MTDAVEISIIAGSSTVLVSLISAYLSYKAKTISEKTHKVVNSRWDEVLKMAEKSFKAQGVEQERSDQRKRHHGR